MLNDPDLLLLDEPYQGFDHGTYVDFWDLVDDWRDEGKAVVIITHLLTETKRADRLEVMRRVGGPALPLDDDDDDDDELDTDDSELDSGAERDDS